mgnify:FL=1
MDTLTIFRRAVGWRFHNRITIAVTLLQPMLWLVLYSLTAGPAMKLQGIENYTAFLFPGLVVLVSFSACGSGGMLNYMMKADGSFYRILTAPVRRGSIVLGQMLEAVLCSLFEVAVMAVISLFFSVKFPQTPGRLALFLVLAGCGAFLTAGLSYGISLALPNEMIYETAMNALALPVFFLSAALFPASQTQGVLGILIRLNPFTYLIGSMRALMVRGEIHPRETAAVILGFLLLGVLAFRWSAGLLEKETRR